MNDWLFEIIQCPATKQPLHVADESLVRSMLAKFQQGDLVNRIGACVDQAFDGGLVNSSATYFYPVREGIPTLVPDEAIPLETKGL